MALRRAGKGGLALHKAVSANADRFAADLAEVARDIHASGQISLRSIAAELTARSIKTRRGGAWQVSNVQALLRRLKAE